MQVRRRANADHYIWGEVCEGWRLLSREDLSVILERIPPGRGEVTHCHRRARQLFFVLQGQLEVRVGPEEARLDPGDSVEIQPGDVHRVWNPSAEDVLFLVVSAPTTHGDRVSVDNESP